MKNLSNINKPVPEATDPPLIKPVSDAIEAVDQAIGAPVDNLTTTAKTLVPALNELKTAVTQNAANLSLFDGNIMKTIYDGATSVPFNALKLNWDSLPLNSVSKGAATLLVLRAAGSNLGLAVVAKISSSTGFALLLTATGVSTHTLTDGVWS